mgnify:CR=1 FL=1
MTDTQLSLFSLRSRNLGLGRLIGQMNSAVFSALCNCLDVSFGTVEILNSCIDDQASQGSVGMTFHTASMGDKVIEI